MQQTLKLLRNSPIIQSCEVIDYRAGKNFQYFHIKAIVKDQSILFIREYRSPTDFKYSYHWQQTDGHLLSRWDNSPHHRDIPTFPHHQHLPDNKIDSYSKPGLVSVLQFIEKILSEPD